MYAKHRRAISARAKAVRLKPARSTHTGHLSAFLSLCNLTTCFVVLAHVPQVTGKVEWKTREDDDDEFSDHLLGSSYGGEL